MVQPGPVRVELLADHKELIPEVGRIRWLEWGDAASLAAWTEVTARESGREELTVTLVAIDSVGHACGAVALGQADDALTEAERAGREPWLLGLVVRSDRRADGLGRRLVEALEDLARERGFGTVWVTTGERAEGFYRRCGWTAVEQLVLSKIDEPNHVLSRSL